MTKKIKILFLAASPRDTSRLRLDEELREIQKRILMATERDRFELISEWAVTPDDLQQALLRHKPHIVHFSGHGSKMQGIILEDKFGNSQLVDKSTLIGLFKILRDNIRIVVLNACYSGHQVEGLSQVIDYTIGVQTPIDDNTAILFAASFYQGLAFGRSVEEAFGLANNRLKAEGVADEALPELIVRANATPSARLWPSPLPFLKRPIAQIIGGVILILGLWLTWAMTIRKPVEVPTPQNTYVVPQNSEKATRYNEAIKLLSNKDSSDTARAGAIYGLGTLASDPNSDELYEPIIRTLATFIRERSRWQANANPDQTEKASVDIQAALEVLAWRKYRWPDTEPQKLDLSSANFKGVILSGREGAHLEGAIFNNAILEGAILRGVNLQRASLVNVNLRNVTFFETDLQDAILNESDIDEANLLDALGLRASQFLRTKHNETATLPDHIVRALQTGN